MNIVKTHKNGGILPGNIRAKKLFSIIIAYSLEKFKIVWYNYKSEERESSPPIVYAFVAQLDRALASDNCDIAGFRLVFARYSAIYAHKNAVVNGSQTTN